MTASLLAKLTFLLFLSLATANQKPEELHKELHEAFRRWIPIRRQTKEELERLRRNLEPTNRIAMWLLVGGAAAYTGAAFMVGLLTPSFVVVGGILLIGVLIIVALTSRVES